MINLYLYLIIYITILIIALIVALCITLINHEVILILENKENKNDILIFRSLKEIKKDVGSEAYKTVEAFESDTLKIIELLYPDYKIVENTLIK